MKRPRTYIDSDGNEHNGVDVQDAYDRNEESRGEGERESESETEEN